MKKVEPYPETHFKGVISIEQTITQRTMIGDIGIQISEDGRIWICINGKAFIRFNSKIMQQYKSQIYIEDNQKEEINGKS